MANLQYGYHTGKLSNKLYMTIVTAVRPRYVSASVVLIDKIVPANVHS